MSDIATFLKDFAVTSNNHYLYYIYDFGSTVSPSDPTVRWRIAYPVVIVVYEKHQDLLVPDDERKSLMTPWKQAPTYIGVKQFNTVEEAVDWVERLD